jgi:hypothetical protein
MKKSVGLIILNEGGPNTLLVHSVIWLETPVSSNAEKV